MLRHRNGGVDPNAVRTSHLVHVPRRSLVIRSPAPASIRVRIRCHFDEPDSTIDLKPAVRHTLPTVRVPHLDLNTDKGPDGPERQRFPPICLAQGASFVNPRITPPIFSHGPAVDPLGFGPYAGDVVKWVW